MTGLIRSWRLLAAVTLLATASAAFAPPPVRPPVVPRPSIPKPSAPKAATPKKSSSSSAPFRFVPVPVPVPSNSRSRSVRRDDDNARNQFRTDIQTKIKDQPHEALRILVHLPRTPRANQPIVAPDEQRRLAHDALVNLAERVETTHDEWQTFFQVQRIGLTKQEEGARRAALGDDGDLIVMTIARRLEQRALAHTLTAVAEAAEQGRWQDAAQEARQITEHPDVKASRVAWKTPSDMQKVFAEVSQRGRMFVLLTQLDVLRQAADRAAALKTLNALDGSLLSEALSESVLSLRVLYELRQMAECQTGFVIATARSHLDKLRAKEPALADRLQQDLAVKLFLDGKPVEASALLPAKASAAHAGELLKDIKILISGQGETTTWPARQVLPREPGGARTPPAGVMALVPKSSVDAWKPQARDVSRVTPSALTELEKLEPVERDRLTLAASAMRAQAQAQAAATVSRLHQLDARYQLSLQQAGKETALLANVKAAAHHELTAAERFLVLGLSDQGRQQADMTAALARFTPPAAVAKNKKK